MTARNVHPEKWTALSDGQHQWGFDVKDGSFLIWNHLHWWNVTQVLEEDGAKTIARFQEPFEAWLSFLKDGCL